MSDYTYPIARSGEQQFACIMRNRSGVDAGCIDMGVRDCTHLSESDQQEIVNIAYAIYESLCKQLSKKSPKIDPLPSAAPGE